MQTHSGATFSLLWQVHAVSHLGSIFSTATADIFLSVNQIMLTSLYEYFSTIFQALF